MLVYDAKGTEYEVPHAIDLAGWLEAGYTQDVPEGKTLEAQVVKKPRAKAIPKQEEDKD